MKTRTSKVAHATPSQPTVPSEPSEESIRECAYALYEKSNRCDGRDVDDWFEATAILQAQAVGAQTNLSR